MLSFITNQSYLLLLIGALLFLVGLVTIRIPPRIEVSVGPLVSKIALVTVGLALITVGILLTVQPHAWERRDRIVARVSEDMAHLIAGGELLASRDTTDDAQFVPWHDKCIVVLTVVDYAKGTTFVTQFATATAHPPSAVFLVGRKIQDGLTVLRVAQALITK
jgi:hypothetical protein